MYGAETWILTTVFQKQLDGTYTSLLVSAPWQSSQRTLERACLPTINIRKSEANNVKSETA